MTTAYPRELDNSETIVECMARVRVLKRSVFYCTGGGGGGGGEGGGGRGGGESRECCNHALTSWSPKKKASCTYIFRVFGRSHSWQCWP